MVATSLPFWMQHPSRTMSHFSFDAATRLPSAGEIAGPDGPLQREAEGSTAVQLCSGEEIAAFEQPWQDLAARALEPNVFIEPGFALPAVRHFASAQRPLFLLVWARQGADHVLIGLCAVQGLRHGHGPNVTAAWTHEQATLGAPLLDRDRAAEALDALLSWLAARSADWSGLLLTGIAVDGPLMRLLAATRRITVCELDRRTRAVLRRADARPELAAALTPKRAKELRRQRNRMAEAGACAFTSARGAPAVKLATERFLDLEARGWKGRQGTALLRHPGLAAFTRAMTRRLAQQGLCRIDSLEIDGRPVAMGIVLRSGDRCYFWKTAFDEAQHRFSPGKQFTLQLGDAQLADPSVALTDSCAIPDHPMIDGLWGDRMIVADMLVAGLATRASSVADAARTIGLWRRCRLAVKRLRAVVQRTFSRH